MIPHEVPHDGRRRIAGGAVHHDDLDFIRRVILIQHGLQTAPHVRGGIVHGNDDRDKSVTHAQPLQAKPMENCPFFATSLSALKIKHLQHYFFKGL